MHYGASAFSTNSLPVLESIPPGLVLGQAGLPEGERGLSAGDIDAVARLYRSAGQRSVTVSTNPPGLDVVVDGIRVATPRRYNWATDSQHVIEAPLQQPGRTDGVRHLFGSWSDGGSRSHSITVEAGQTWYEANFIVQHQVAVERLPADIDASELGRVVVTPSSTDGYRTLRTPFQVSADADSSATLRFWQWFTGWRFRFGGPLLESGLLLDFREKREDQGPLLPSAPAARHFQRRFPGWGCDQR